MARFVCYDDSPQNRSRATRQQPSHSPKLDSCLPSNKYTLPVRETLLDRSNKARSPRPLLSSRKMSFSGKEKSRPICGGEEEETIYG